MQHNLCRSFHPWCPGVKNRCLLCQCDTNHAGHFTLDAHASRPVACYPLYSTTYHSSSIHEYIKLSFSSVAIHHIDSLVQDCSNSIANALKLLQSCAKPSIYSYCHLCTCLSSWFPCLVYRYYIFLLPFMYTFNFLVSLSGLQILSLKSIWIIY